MIVFYDKSGICIRAANGIAADVVVSDDRAYYNSEVVLVGMKGVTYADLPEQDIHEYFGELPTLKAFSKLKTGVPLEVRLSKLEKDVKEIKGKSG